VDSKTGVPLKFTLSPKGGGKAIVDIGFTKVGFGKPSASTFDFTPPKGSKVTEGTQQGAGKGAMGLDGVNGTDSAGQHTVIGSGWDSIAVIKSAGGIPTGTEKNGRSADSMLNSFGKHVTGSFGSGTVFHTRLVNALLTDKGTLYVGAVTQSALTDAANAAAK